MNGKDDRHEILASIGKTDDTSNASTDSYFGGGITGFVPVNESLDLYLSLATVASKNLDLAATQSQVLSSLALNYRYTIFKVPSVTAYEFRINRDKYSQSELSIPNLIQYNQSVTSVHEVFRSFSLLWGIHQGSSDNLATGGETRITYNGMQIDLGVRQKVASNLFVNYWADYEYRVKEYNGESSGGFQINDGANKFMLRYAIEIGYRFNS